MGGDSAVDWQKSITSILAGSKSSSDDDAPRQVKKLRKLVLLSLQMDDSDKSAKKQFKKTIQTMEQDGTLRLDADGTITLLKNKSKKKKHKDDDDDKKKKRKLSKEEKKSKKKKKQKTSDDDKVSEENIENDDSEVEQEDKTSNGQGDADEESGSQAATSSSDKNKPCKGNPQGVTRLFLGNLPFAVDESSLAAFLPGGVTHIKWITDKETGKFYGSAFVETDNSTSAAEAVAMAGSKLIGRPIKINFAPAREGDIWPPAKKVVSGGSTGGGGQAGGSGIKAMSAKPDNCMKLFIGNLSYDIDDEGITKFFGSVDAEVKAVRWLHHRDTGDFKGVGFVEFWNTEACEKAATLNGKNLLGRPIRIDWTD